MRKSSHAKLTNYARRSMMFPLVHHTEQLLLKGQFRLFTQAQTSSTQKDIIKICFGVREDLFSSLRQGFRAQKPLYESLSLSISLKCCFCPEQLESKCDTDFPQNSIKQKLKLCYIWHNAVLLFLMNESAVWTNQMNDSMTHSLKESFTWFLMNESTVWTNRMNGSMTHSLREPFTLFLMNEWAVWTNRMNDSMPHSLRESFTWWISRLNESMPHSLREWPFLNTKYADFGLASLVVQTCKFDSGERTPEDVRTQVRFFCKWNRAYLIASLSTLYSIFQATIKRNLLQLCIFSSTIRRNML